MSEPNDERLALPIEQSVLLWCMRVWVLEACQPSDVERRIQEMLARLEAPDAAPHLGEFMSALSGGATRTVGVDCVCQPRLSEDERALLDVFGLVQEDRPFQALLLLRGLLTPEAARAALCSAQEVGAALARVGRYLLAPQEEMRRFAWMVEAAKTIHRTETILH